MSISAVTLHIEEYKKEIRSTDILQQKTKGQILLFSLLPKHMLSRKNTLYQQILWSGLRKPQKMSLWE